MMLRRSTAGQSVVRFAVSSWVKGIDAITLFVEDLAAANAFYVEVFELPVAFEDPNSAVFMFGETAINLLDVRQAAD